jgi:hypothetical protein
MNMDDQYEQMGLFQKVLIDFNQRLRVSMIELRDRHEAIAGMWQDNMRREYDRHWTPLEEEMNHYIGSEGPGYVEFLSLKHQALHRYLFGEGF